MTYPAKKSKITKKKTNLMSLPNHLLLNCLARVSRQYCPTLSLVSKSFRSLIASPEVYKVRPLLGCTETCLYVCIHLDYHCCWFTLCRISNQTHRKSSGCVLAPLPIPFSPPLIIGSLVSVGSNIYHIQEPSNLSILDCRSHVWREGPRLREKLVSFYTSVFDQKIYVAGLCEDDKSASFKNTIQVFDTETEIWDPEVPSCSEINDDIYHRTACFNGKLHVLTLRDRKVAAYDSKENRWDLVLPRMADGLISDSYCVIENVLYSVSKQTIKWYDSEESKWREVWKEVWGMVGIHKFPGVLRLADYGGKLAVLWADTRFGNRVIRCAVIALQRRTSKEIWGKVEWFDRVLTIPLSKLVPMKVLGVTL